MQRVVPTFFFHAREPLEVRCVACQYALLPGGLRPAVLRDRNQDEEFETYPQRRAAMITDVSEMAETPGRRIHAATLVTILIVGVLLSVGREVFLPLAVATLITFALTPAVGRMRALRLPRVASVLVVVTLAFAVIGIFFFVVAAQFTSLAADLPTFQANIVAKMERLQTAGEGSNLLGRLAEMLSRIGSEFSATMSTTQPANGAASGPVMVEVVQNENPLQAVLGVVLAMVSPVATTGLVIIVVIFMLLEREDLRDRFIRLVGSTDLHRTTEMLQDAGSRVATYLLIQLLVNVIYAVPIGLGLWLIGVPNPLLWALLTLVLRFVPYIGTALAAIFPIALAFAVSADWSMVIWTVALFIFVELVTSNLIEPWLYGSRTGLSPLAVIIAAIVWSFIWGPMGLILSTPLTVCLVVLGRYLPQFEVFDIIFGDQPVLAPHARLYQRLLAGDVVESAARAEDALEEVYVADYYQDVGIPALLLAQNDYDRGVLNQTQSATVAHTAAGR
jgi:predicted PurR-regulated permease PerM